MGEFAELRGLHVLAGFNSQGIIFAPGAGKALAEWIVQGHPTMDLSEVDVARAGRWQNNRAWLRERTGEMLGRLYAMHWPGLQSITGRGVRRTPLFDRLAAGGAVFGEAGGWERANWFDTDGSAPDHGYSFDRPNWLGAVSDECRAARAGAALFDLSTYSKFLVQGPEALAGLQRLCASDIDVPVGRIVYTTMCNERGGIEMDPTVTRLGPEQFMVAAPTLAQRRMEMLLRRGMSSNAIWTDVTSGMAVMLLAGPLSRKVLSAVTDAELSDEAFPLLSARAADLGWAQGWLLRVSYVGELGWELWVPAEFAADLHDKVLAAGEDVGLRHAGYFAMDALRLERGFRSWGHDMGQLDDPFQSGLGFTVSSNKDAEYGGRAALEKLRHEPAVRRLVSLMLRDPGDPGAHGPLLWHGESVMLNGVRAGRVTSGAFGPTLGRSVGLAWLLANEPITEDFLDGATIEVEVRDRLVPATAGVRAFYEPGSP